MGSPHHQNIRAQHRDNAHRLRYRAATQGLTGHEPGGLSVALVMTSIGTVFMLGFILALLNGGSMYASPLLLFGCSLFTFGLALLAVVLGERIAKRLIRRKKHCGCCVFYQPQDEAYDVGLCQTDPREGFVQRTHSCPYFRYSERAMVRDRLAQRPEMLKQIRVIRADDGQPSSE
jgi:hypothetical protein